MATGFKVWSWASAIFMVIGALGVWLADVESLTKVIVANWAAWGVWAANKIQKYPEAVSVSEVTLIRPGGER